jgi:hypothetical protein
MKLALSFALAFTPLLAHADDGSCAVNAAKLTAAFKAAVTTFLQNDLNFAWDPATLKVTCGTKVGNNSQALAGCSVAFSAKDGTAFFLYDDEPASWTDTNGNTWTYPSSSTSVSINDLARSRPSDDEGNFTGPAVCEAEIYNPPYVQNKKTGVILPLRASDGIPAITYLE